jgi:cysteine desulfurase
MEAPGPGSAQGRVYADHGSATPLHPAARMALLESPFADPRRLHAEGRLARRALDDGLASLAADLGCRPDELVLTSGLAQSLRWGVRGVRLARRRLGTRVVAGATERSEVLEEGVDRVGVDSLGRIDRQAWEAAVAQPGTVLSVLQLANQEIGTTQSLPVEGAVSLLCDISAAVSHLDVATLAATADLCAAWPQLWGGPAGVGLLVVRTGTRWNPPEPAGPAPVPLVVAAAAALRQVTDERDGEAARLRVLTGRLRSALQAVPDLVVHGDPEHRLPGLVAVSALYVDAEALVGHLDRAGIAVDSGSACTSQVGEPSHVLAATGALTHGNLRLTLGRTTTAPDVERIAAEVPRALAAVRDAAGVTGW